MRPETILENYLYTKATENNVLCYKFISAETGVPDRILVGNNLTVFVELKATNGVLSERQKFVIKSMKKHGAIVFIPYSKQDIDEIINFITKKNGCD